MLEWVWLWCNQVDKHVKNFDDLYNFRIVGIILLSLTKHDSTRSISTSSTAPSSDKARRRMVLTIHTKRCQVSLTLCQSSITIIAKTWTVFLSKLCTNKNEYFQIWDPYLISILSQREHRVSTTEPSPQITDHIISPQLPWWVGRCALILPHPQCEPSNWPAVK